jgi:hypothetical protein
MTDRVIFYAALLLKVLSCLWLGLILTFVFLGDQATTNPHRGALWFLTALTLFIFSLPIGRPPR